MTNQRESLKSKIARLRAGFFEELPERIAKIEQNFDCLTQNPHEIDCQKELHRRIHNIKGAAASFGLTELAQLAKQAETKIKQMQESPVQQRGLWLEELALVLKQFEGHINTDTASAYEYHFPSFDLSTEKNPVSELNNPLIYICDDDAALLENLKIQLACFAYESVDFFDPEALLAAVKKQRPDMIIMDIVFPGGELIGVDCIKKIQDVYSQNIPVIFISGRTDFDARLYSVQAGGAAYLTKPFKIMTLVDTLDAILSPVEAEPHRILIIDDDVKVAQYHSLILQEAGIMVRVIYSVTDVLEVIFDFKPDLILVDMYMPISNGRELAQVIRQIPDYLSLPILYLSSETDAKTQFSALRVGADGFLNKPIEPDRLLSEVLLRIERMKAMRFLMMRDSLTGLLNHTAIFNALRSVLAHAQRQQQPFAFAMLDVDHFKKVNDTYGHIVGDQVLLALSRILKQRLRKSDYVGRYGGEEFAIVLPDIDSSMAFKLVNELREAFQNVVFNSEQGEFSCSLSAGLVVFPELTSLHELVSCADAALYQAKNQGRNQTVQGCQGIKR